MTHKIYTTQFDMDYLLRAWNSLDRSTLNMAPAPGKTQATSALLTAIDFDGYDWITQHAPFYLDKIEDALDAGMTPEEIGNFIQRHVGSDRVGLALRIEQCARHILRSQE